MMTVLRHNGPSIAFGAVLGLIATSALSGFGWSFDDIGWRWYDEWRPVATINAQRMPGPVGETRALLTVQRHRPECKFVQAAAFEMLPAGSAVRVFSARVDAQPTVNVPSGVQFRAEWRFWPIGIGKLAVWMEYQCDGRSVRVEVRGLT